MRKVQKVHWGSITRVALLCGAGVAGKEFFDYAICGEKAEYRSRITCEKCLALAAESAKLQSAKQASEKVSR